MFCVTFLHNNTQDQQNFWWGPQSVSYEGQLFFLLISRHVADGTQQQQPARDPSSPPQAHVMRHDMHCRLAPSMGDKRHKHTTAAQSPAGCAIS